MAKAKVTHKNKLDVIANPKVEVGLTPKQEKFAQIYATEEVTQTEAAIRAGYAKSNAHAIASHMLNGRSYPLVLERIFQIKKEIHGVLKNVVLVRTILKRWLKSTRKVETT